jgi:hypothetical protein
MKNMTRMTRLCIERTKRHFPLKRSFFGFLLIISILFSGCQSGKQQSPQPLSTQSTSLDIHTPVRYKLNLQRETTIQLSPGNALSPKGPQQMLENLEMMFSIRMVSEGSNQATFEVSCEKVDARRKDFTNTSVFYDALKSLEGKSYPIVISNDGQWVNRKEVESVFQKATENSISLIGRRRIKRPDFVADFAAITYRIGLEWMQAEETGALSKGQTWRAQHPMPGPVPDARIPDAAVECRIQEVQSENPARKVVVEERYSVSSGTPVLLPNFYAGESTMDGLLGFLRNVHFDSITGEGQKVLSQAGGFVDQGQEHNIIKGKAVLSIPVDKPDAAITMDQTIEIRRVVESKAV